ncbi:MAG: Bug family tripartite tricarboxylate transporter substrate binding protein [Xanthobacteraceae bacterium]
MLTRRRFSHGATAAAMFGGFTRAASAQQDYPNRPIHVLIGFAAGSGADILCRFFIAKLAELSGQSVVIENRPGAVGVISANLVAKAKPDGYTMWWGGNSIMVGGKYLVKDMPFDPMKEFIPAGAFLETPFVIAVGAKSPAKSVSELIALLKSKTQNRSAYTNPTGQVSTALFKVLTGVESESVSYKTTADAIPDLADGTLDYMILDGTFAVGQVKSGRIRALAATSAGRITALPDVPTMQEAGVKDFVFSPWWGAYLPAGTPQPIVDKVAGWMNQMARAPESAKFLDTLAALPVLDNPKEMTARLQDDRVVWDKLAAAAKLEPN